MAMPQVIGTDIAACNGVVHVVDEVILPEYVCFANLLLILISYLTPLMDPIEIF